jgi:hypothetical protein
MTASAAREARIRDHMKVKSATIYRRVANAMPAYESLTNIALAIGERQFSEAKHDNQRTSAPPSR